MIKQYPVSHDGWIYLLVLALIVLDCYFILPWLTIVPGILFLFIMFFFRNPNRQVSNDPRCSLTEIGRVNKL